MIWRNLTTAIFGACLLFLPPVWAQQSIHNSFGTDWEFRRDEKGANWEKVNIPHSAKIEPLVVKNQFQGTSYYRKTFRIEKTKGKKVFLHFEGVMQEAAVTINGKHVQNHKGGYLPFTVDATNYIKPNSDNLIEITVVNIDNPTVPPGKALKDLDFNYYGGIYRNVQLIITNKLHITNAVHANKKASGGIAVNFDNVSNLTASGMIKVHLKNDHNSKKKATLVFQLTDRLGKISEFKSDEFTIAGNTDLEIFKNIRIDNPALWSVNDPALYHLEIKVVFGNKVIDSHIQKIGIRSAEIRDDGYFINGEKLYIAGTNRHQEYPYVGYAISDEAQYRDAIKIKNAGFDFVRLSHYPQADAFLNACDELGILVMNSIPGWQFFGDDAFQQNAYQDIRDMARRDRNHPSVVFWEVSLNESNMDAHFMKKANEILREELPYKNVYTAGWMDNDNYDLYVPARQHGKAPDYWTKYNRNNRKIFIAEYGDWEYYAQNAGFSQKEFSNLKEEERTSRQLRAFGEKRLLQQAFNFQEASNSNRKGKATIGEANWLMFDYNRGYADDLESSGICDIFRIPKFAYYFYQSQRSAKISLDKKLVSGPMINIASYWSPKSATDITIYSNCDEVALYLNDILISKEKPFTYQDSDELKHPPFIFRLKNFTPGTLRAEGFIGGKKVTEHVVRTPGKVSGIALSYDISEVPISKHSPDVIFIYARIIDANGTVVPDAINQVTFTVNGSQAQLIGENPVTAEAGIATILLRTESLKLPIEIQASAVGLPPVQITIK